ncbi:hypothetical protein K435DRAFT_775490 [Dendrothele bispora CBS 962.96]|uniref:Uncharacterized protein n=1 Tax=Dendrothele bispora (strain CBS 962.96) TaxID=1314807 RepID=A0A4S8MIT8_DENBC|nr:hypothetical protein K435DRAFT_775490 [Dendrothele bispora CBS 962.96]
MEFGTPRVQGLGLQWRQPVLVHPASSESGCEFEPLGFDSFPASIGGVSFSSEGVFAHSACTPKKGQERKPFGDVNRINVHGNGKTLTSESAGDCHGERYEKLGIGKMEGLIKKSSKRRMKREMGQRGLFRSGLRTSSSSLDDDEDFEVEITDDNREDEREKDDDDDLDSRPPLEISISSDSSSSSDQDTSISSQSDLDSFYALSSEDQRALGMIMANMERQLADRARMTKFSGGYKGGVKKTASLAFLKALGASANTTVPRAKVD